MNFGIAILVCGLAVMMVGAIQTEEGAQITGWAMSVFGTLLVCLATYLPA